MTKVNTTSYKQLLPLTVLFIGYHAPAMQSEEGGIASAQSAVEFKPRIMRGSDLYQALTSGDDVPAIVRSVGGEVISTAPATLQEAREDYAESRQIDPEFINLVNSSKPNEYIAIVLDERQKYWKLGGLTDDGGSCEICLAQGDQSYKIQITSEQLPWGTEDVDRLISNREVEETINQFLIDTKKLVVSISHAASRITVSTNRHHIIFSICLNSDLFDSIRNQIAPMLPAPEGTMLRGCIEGDNHQYFRQLMGNLVYRLNPDID